MLSGKQLKRDKFISFKELLPRIIVKDPVTHDSWDKGRFTTYLVCIKTEHPAFHLRLSAVRRRFSELRWLYKVLKANHSYVQFPNPPSKKVFAERFDQDFINSRMVEIQSYLNELLVTDTVLSDAAFHFFIQTDLTTEEIEEYLNGALPETIVTEAWENAGHLHTSSYIVNTNIIPHEPQEIVMNEEDLQPAQHNSRSFDASHSLSSFEDSTLAVAEANDSTSDVAEANDVFLNDPAPTTTNGDEVAAVDLISQREAASSSNGAVSNGDDAKEFSSEFCDISDDSEVVIYTESDVVKITLPAKNV